MLRFVARVTKDLPSVGAADVQALREAGWGRRGDFYFAVTTCALFNFYNRLGLSATGVPVMSADAHREQGRQLATRGYTRGLRHGTHCTRQRAPRHPRPDDLPAGDRQARSTSSSTCCCAVRTR
jgi:hypothetical protein